MKKTLLISLVVIFALSMAVTNAMAATTISTNISTGGTLAVTGASTLTGNVAAAGTLAVTGASTLTGAVTATAGIISGSNIKSDTTSTDSLGLTGTRWASTFSDNFTGNTITLDGATTVNVLTITDNVADALSIVDSSGDLIVFDTQTGSEVVTITPNTAITGTLAVTGATTFTGAVTANGGITLGAGDDLIGSATSDITINTNKFTVAGATGNTVVGGTFTSDGASTLTGAVTATAGIISGSNIKSDTTSTDSLGLTGTRWASTFSDNFTGNTITLDGATTVNVLTITDNVADALSIVDSSGDLIVFDTQTGSEVVTITPNTAITGTLAVTGATTFTGAVTANGGITLGAADDLIGSATSDITINTTAFTVAGATGNTAVGGTLAVTGVATFTSYVTADGYRVTNGTPITASGDLTKANLQAASHFNVDMTGGSVDIDLGEDAVLDAADVGRKLTFAVGTAGGTLTVSAGSLVTNVTTVVGSGAAADAAGDFIECLVVATDRISCVSYAQ